jgi:FHA domain-containing protein
MAAHADPMRALQAAPQATAQALPDDFSDLNRAFQLPTPPAPAPVPMASPPPPTPPAAAIPGGGPVLSWDSGAEGHTVIRPSAARAPEPAAMPMPSAPAPVPVPAAMAPVVAAPVPAPRPAPAPTPISAAASNDLLAAFREGLATPEVPLEALTPEMMKLIGQIVREAAAGTVDLLVARAALKREVKAEATMIVARENNPLKFSPSAEAALQHLLAPPLRGFMPAAPAMRDAYNDLRAHQFGFIAGMKAALTGVLGRFDPGELEGRLTKVSGLKSILPGARKAALWDLFVEHYAAISAEAEDDFHSLFGKAFLKAYEEHIAQLERGQH